MVPLCTRHVHLLTMLLSSETVNVTLFGKTVFAETIKDLGMRRSFWIIQVVPKCNDKCLYKKKAECYLTGTEKETLRERPYKDRTEVEVM